MELSVLHNLAGLSVGQRHPSILLKGSESIQPVGMPYFLDCCPITLGVTGGLEVPETSWHAWKGRLAEYSSPLQENPTPGAIKINKAIDVIQNYQR